MTREDCYWATLLGYLEMISTGTTACLSVLGAYGRPVYL